MNNLILTTFICLSILSPLSAFSQRIRFEMKGSYLMNDSGRKNKNISFICVLLLIVLHMNAKAGGRFEFDIELQFPKKPIEDKALAYRLTLNGFLIGPNLWSPTFYLSSKRNQINITFGNHQFIPDLKRNDIVLKISHAKQVIFKRNVDSYPFQCFFDLVYKYEIVWKSAEELKKLSHNDREKIKELVNSMLDAYELDKIEDLEKCEKNWKMRMKAINISQKNPIKNISFFDKPFYERVFHGKHREKVIIARNFVIELNKNNTRVVNVYRKNGKPILTLVSKHMLPTFGGKQVNFTTSDYYYNFIKIDEKWWFY